MERGNCDEWKAFTEFMLSSVFDYNYVSQLVSTDNPRPVSVRIT